MRLNTNKPGSYESPTFALVPNWVLNAKLDDHALRLYCVLSLAAQADNDAIFDLETLHAHVDDTRRAFTDAILSLARIGALDLDESQ
jgi:hypothetical protein